MKEEVRRIIIGELGEVMKVPGALYVKFTMMAMCIEYLGACLDRQHLKATGRSEKRFAMAIRQLFPPRYHHYVKEGAQPDLYTDFRCALMHRFAVGPEIQLTTRDEVKTSGYKHLNLNTGGQVVLVLEDLYDDLVLAAGKFNTFTA
jgi:hypothetical protein